MKTFAFPLDASSGTLKLVSGDEAAKQLVGAVTRTLPGELPLSRTYGIFIDYNIPHELARVLNRDVKEGIQRWYPEIAVRSAEVRFDRSGKEAEVSVDLELTGE